LVKGVPEFVTDNAFYPKRTVVHKGDKVAFRILGFHTVTLAPKGKEPSLFLPDPSKPVAGVKDAAGADFWFNGNPSVGVNPLAAALAGGHTFDGSKLVGSGSPAVTGMLDDVAATPLQKSATVSFSRPGTYQYFCIVHGAQMKGQITVTN
jgi:plastocyanin